MKRFHRSPTQILKALKKYREEQRQLKALVKTQTREEEKITRKKIRENEFRLSVLEVARYAEINNIRGIKLNMLIKQYFINARKRMICRGGYNGNKFKVYNDIFLFDVSSMFFFKKCVEYWRYTDHDQLTFDFNNKEPGKPLDIDFIPEWLTMKATNDLYRRKNENYNPFKLDYIKYLKKDEFLDIPKSNYQWKRKKKSRKIIKR